MQGRSQMEPLTKRAIARGEYQPVQMDDGVNMADMDRLSSFGKMLSASVPTIVMVIGSEGEMMEENEGEPRLLI